MHFFTIGKGFGFLSDFLLSLLRCTVENVRGCVSFKKFQGKAVQVTVNSKEERS
jgi:hypothetical protein